VNIIQASNGSQFDIDSASQTYTYNGDGTLNYIEVTYRSYVYRQSYTYNASGQVTTISRWVKQ
jgi:hypothetical protein